MNKLILYIAIGLFVFSFASCDEDKIFKEELYEKKVYIVSNDDQIFNLEYSLDDENPASEVSVAVSGTNRIERDIRVTLERDTILLKKHNYSNYELAYEKYAKEMDFDAFSMPTMSLYLKENSADVYATLPVNVSYDVLASLSPDSSYFIPLAIKDISSYTINGAKNNVLCKIQKENKYAKTLNPVYYTIKGYQTRVKANGNSVSSISGSKIYHPLTQNTVRAFVGNKPFISQVDSIAKYAITITINGDNSLVLSKYNENSTTLEFQQLAPESSPTFIYKNIYDEENNRFLMHYKYRVKGSNGVWSDWYIVQEANKRNIDEDADE